MEMEAIMAEYGKELARITQNAGPTDPHALERHRPALEHLANMSNVGITVFDLHRREHIFTSYNFHSLFGYDLDRIENEGNEYFDSRVHPDDQLGLLLAAMSVLRLYNSLPANERDQYKLVNEYRILNRDSEYVRVIEQHQTLELDGHGEPWLSLGVMDISPTQDAQAGARSCILNFKTGKVYHSHNLGPDPAVNPPKLSAREKEILALIGDGMLSKEISERLFISVHTVNTHRQRILEKLNADNSMEAVKFARSFGLIAG